MRVWSIFLKKRYLSRELSMSGKNLVKKADRGGDMGDVPDKKQLGRTKGEVHGTAR